MRAPRFALGAALLTAALPATAAGNIFCCQDEHGRNACGDILPSVCVGRAYREIGPNGLVVRRVEAPPTAEQRAQKAAEERRQKAAEEAARERRRLDQALLQTYGSEADIDQLRERAEADAVAAIKAAEEKIVEAGKRRKKFEDEAEFYRKKPLPPAVTKGLKAVDEDILAQQATIEAKKKELETIRARYEDDKRRYRELRGSRMHTP